MSDQSNKDSMVHNLRDRTGINPTLRYSQQLQNWNSSDTLRRKRAGKKGSITRRIRQINEIIAERGSRSKLTVLLEQLKVTLNDTIILHEALMEKIDKNGVDYTNDYIEELSIEVDTCTGNVAEYLEERSGDPSSNGLSSRGTKSSYTGTSDDRTRRWCEEQGILGAEYGDVFPGIISSKREVPTTTIDPLLEGVCTGFHSQASALNSPYVHKSEKRIIEDKLASGETHTVISPTDPPASKRVFNLAEIPHIYKLKDSNENELMSRASTEYCELPLGISLLNVNSFEDPSLSSSTAEANMLIHPSAGQDMNIDTLTTYTLQGVEKSMSHIPQMSARCPTSHVQLSTPLFDPQMKAADKGTHFKHHLTHLDEELSHIKTSLQSFDSDIIGPNHNGNPAKDRLGHAAVTEYGFPGIRPPTHSRHVTFCAEFSSYDPLSLQRATLDMYRTECFETPLIYSFSNMNPLHISCCSPSIVEGIRQSYPLVRRKMNTETLPTYTSQRAQNSMLKLPISTHQLTPDLPPWAFSSGQESSSLANQTLLGIDATHTNDNCNYPQHSYGHSEHALSNDGATPLYSTVRQVVNPKSQPNYGQQGVSAQPSNVAFSQSHTLHHLPYNRFDTTNVLHNQANNQIPLGSPSVDKWIDELPQWETDYVRQIESTVNANNMMQRWMVNQNLPMMDIPRFDGSPLQWIDFITHFREIVHLQPYLTTARRMAYLQQHLESEAKRAVRGFKGDWLGYVSALKRLKFMFGQRASVAHAHISKITKGKQIKDSDMTALIEMFYDISDCLSNLQKLEYYSDLGSTDVLRQTIARLPPRFKTKWCERSYYIRRTQEPNLYHLAEWLGDRIMAARDPYMPQDGSKANTTLGLFMTEVSSGTSNTGTKIEKVCLLCKEKGHMVFKCKQYTEAGVGDRFEIAKKNNLCYNCLRPNHSTKNCKSRFNCFVDGCTQSHHTSLHDHFKNKKIVSRTTSVTSNTVVTSYKLNVIEGILTEGEEENTIKNDNVEDSVASMDRTLNVARTNATLSRRVYFKTVPVKIFSEGGVVIETHAFLDDGSEGTFIHEDLANLLKIKGCNVDIMIGTIVDADGEKIHTKKTAFTISGIHTNAKRFSISDALVLPGNKFNAKAQHLPSDFHTNKSYKHLQGFNFKDIAKDKIQLLVGTDHYETSLVTQMQKGDGGRPIAVKTPLGWTLFGMDDLSGQGCEVDIRINFVKTDELTELSETVHKFWTTESFGTEFKGTKSYSLQDRVIEHEWDLSTGHKNGHYIVSMPWKGHSVNLPDSRFVAEKRFQGLLNRFKRNPELHKMYSENIKDYVNKGYARKMTEAEVNRRSKRTWYLPHHPVTNVNKPNKVRTVFDAAAKSKGASLNDQLHTGPDLVNNLAGILLRFRNHHIAFTADVEAMFHQVYVSEEDSDALRFLWKDDLDDSVPFEVYQMLVHIFGAKSSPSCTAYALRKSALGSSANYPVEPINAILHDFYVDDFLKSQCSIQEAITTALDVIKILEEHGFNLTKFMSNCPQVLNAIPESKLAHQREFFELEDEPVERTLGVRWNIKKDTFTFVVDCKDHTVTKRGILRTVSSIFDPLGFLTPFTVRAKIFVAMPLAKEI